MSVIFEKYLSESNSDYVGVYESSGSVTSYSYGYVGNNSSLTAFFLMFKLTDDFPFAGVTVGSAASSADRVETAIFRMAEVNAGTRGSSPLTLKVSPIYSTWNPSASWASIPGYRSSIVDTYSSFGDAPSSSNYDYRTGSYKQYYYQCEGKYGSGTAYTVGSYYWFTEYTDGNLTVLKDGTYYYFSWHGTTRTLYSVYIVYHDIDITDVIKDCITNGATGLICYFDITNSTYNRKVFETTKNTVTGRQPKLTISFSDEAVSTNPPIQINTALGAIDKQVTAKKIWTGSAWKAQVGGKEFNGSTWKGVF